MGTPWMTEPKEGELYSPEWRTPGGGRPASAAYGKAFNGSGNWRRPDPNYEHPDAGEVIDAAWRFIGEFGDRFVAPGRLGNPCGSPTWWVRPIRRAPEAALGPLDGSLDEHQRMLEFLSRGRHVNEKARKAAWAAWEAD